MCVRLAPIQLPKQRQFMSARYSAGNKQLMILSCLPAVQRLEKQSRFWTGTWTGPKAQGLGRGAKGEVLGAVIPGWRG
jgi:hypothetical protein